MDAPARVVAIRAAAAAAAVALSAATAVAGAVSTIGGAPPPPAAPTGVLSDRLVVALGVVTAVVAIFVASKLLWPPADAAAGSATAGLTAAAASGTGVPVSATPTGDAVIAADAYTAFPLTHKTVTSHNTRLFRFGLPSPTATLGLPLGRHLSVRATVDGKDVKRPYTPTSGLSTAGHFELLIKVYPEPHGTMSRHLDALAIGDTIDVRGPLGKFAYTRGMAAHVCMIAGGTGITPMWQVLTALMADPEDTTRLSLILANVTPDDILLKEQLDALAAAGGKNALTVYYVLNKPDEGWTGGVGFVTADHIQATFGPRADDALVLLCGPPPMNKAMLGNLDKLGYTPEQIFKF